MDACYVTKINSPLGYLTLSSDGENITGLWIEGQKYFGSTLLPGARAADLAVFSRARAWLDAYFSGARPDSTPPLLARGSAFQTAVWAQLSAIAYGQVTSYGQIARRLQAQTGRPVSARAVGGAVGRNPISILIPCHRVVGADGSLTGYAGGLERKKYLLRLEGARVKGLYPPPGP